MCLCCAVSRKPNIHKESNFLNFNLWRPSVVCVCVWVLNDESLGVQLFGVCVCVFHLIAFLYGILPVTCDIWDSLGCILTELAQQMHLPDYFNIFKILLRSWEGQMHVKSWALFVTCWPIRKWNNLSTLWCNYSSHLSLFLYSVFFLASLALIFFFSCSNHLCLHMTVRWCGDNTVDISLLTIFQDISSSHFFSHAQA